MKFCVIILMLVLSACATTLTKEEEAECSSTEDKETCLVDALENKKVEEQYRREDRDTLFREQFYEFAATCKASGGAIWISRHTPRYCPRAPCPPDWGDSFWCQ